MRGMTEAALVGIILALVGGLVVTGLAASYVAKGRDKIDLDACHNNVLNAARFDQLVQITQCNTKRVGLLEGTTQQLAAKVSTLVDECMYQFGEAKHAPWKGELVTGDPICFVCSQFSVPSTVERTAVTDYMSNQQPLKASGTLLEYVRPRLPFNDDAYLFTQEVVQKREGTTFTPEVLDFGALYAGENYAVIHYSWPQARGAQATGTAADAQTIGAGGSEEMTIGEYSSIFVTPLSTMDKTCAVTYTRY